MNIKRPSTTEEWYKFMAAYSPTWTPAKVDASIRNYGQSQLNDTYQDLVRTVDSIFNRGMAQQLGQLINALNQKGATEEWKRKEIQNWASRNKDAAESMSANKRILEQYVNAGILDKSAMDQFNSLVQGVKQYIPNLSVQPSTLGTKEAAPPSKDELINLVAGKGTAGAVTPTTTIPATGSSVPTAKSLPMELAQYVVNNNIQNLENYDWWKNNPNKDQAWKLVTGGAVKPSSAGITDRQLSEVATPGTTPGTTPAVVAPTTTSAENFATMNGQQLFKAIYDGKITPSRDNPLWTSLYQNGQATPAMQEAFSKWTNYLQNNPGYVPPQVQQQAPISSVTTPAPSATPGVATTGYDEALRQLESNAQFQALPDSLKSLFRETLKGFDYSQDVNIENILKSFTNIKNTTIDPRFSKEVESFTNQVQREYSDLQAQRQAEVEAERASAGQNIAQAKGALEASGLTFTGQGIENLGSQAAYGQAGGAIPTQTPVSPTEDLTTKGGMTFTDGRFFEGNVNQANRLMSSSSALRYQKNLQQLGQQAENVLGGKNNLIPGYVTTGNLPGSMEDQRQGMYADTLAAIAQQQREKNAYNQPLNYQFPSYQ